MENDASLELWKFPFIFYLFYCDGFPKEVTKCQTVEDRVDCQSRTFREKVLYLLIYIIYIIIIYYTYYILYDIYDILQVLSQCKCSPFSLRSYYGKKVIYSSSFITIII